MSHVVEIDCKVQEPCMLALEEAAKRCGCEIVKQNTYRWYGHHVGDFAMPAGFTEADLGKCDYAIRIAGLSDQQRRGGPYEIGLVRKVDEETGEPYYAMLFDFWNGGYGMEAKVGAKCDNLLMLYQAEVTKMVAAQQGMQAFEETMEDGTIVVCVETEN